jgi:hypothetical protein
MPAIKVRMNLPMLVDVSQPGIAKGLEHCSSPIDPFNQV